MQSKKIETVVFVVPTSSLHNCNHAVPTHVLQLAAYLRATAKVEVHVVDMLMDFGYPVDSAGEEMLDSCLVDHLVATSREPADTLVGFSLTSSYDLMAALPMMLAFKNETEAMIVAGGYAATLHAKLLEKLPFIDYIICGPGEEALVRLIEDISAGKKGEKVRDGRTIINRTDLSSLCLDFRPLVNLPAYRRVLIYTSFGCAHACKFCYESMMHPTKTYLSLQRILRDFSMCRRQLSGEVEMIRIADPTWAEEPERTADTLSAAKAFGFKISFETRADTLQSELLRQMAGTVPYIIFGFESASRKVLRSMNKCRDVGAYLTRMKDAVLESWALGIVPRINLIINYPGSSHEDHLECIKYVEALRELHDKARFDVGFMLTLSWFHAFGCERAADAAAEKDCSWEDALPRSYRGFSLRQPLARVCVGSSKTMSFWKAIRICRVLCELARFSSTKANEIFCKHIFGPGADLKTLSEAADSRQHVVSIRDRLNTAGRANLKKARRNGEPLVMIAFPRWPGHDIARLVHERPLDMGFLGQVENV